MDMLKATGGMVGPVFRGKLDGYRDELNNGKELNEDQLNAIGKYEQVVEVLDLAKDLQKNFFTIIQDAAKHQKKVAKREQLERQQQEMQKIKELLILQDILNRIDTEEVRNDFLSGSNGALKLAEDDLNNLDELFKLVSPDRGSEEEEVAPFEEQLTTCSEHIFYLIEGRNKEVLGTTYKNLKELLSKIHESGYFDDTPKDAPGEPEEACENVKPVDYESGEAETSMGDNYTQAELRTEIVPGENCQVQLEHTQQVRETGDASGHVDRAVYPAETVAPTSGTKPIQEVLAEQGNFNFLQESQIDLESPHMDPAVVVAHPMTPAPPMGYHPAQYPVGSTVIHITDNQQPQNQTPQDGNVARVQSTQQTSSVTQLQQSQVLLSEIDPAQPIPTQTFTNQNYPSIQNMLHPAGGASTYPAYAPVTLSHGQQVVGLTMAPPNISSSSTSTSSPPAETGGLNHPSHISDVTSQEDTKDHYNRTGDYQTTSTGEEPLEESQFSSSVETQETSSYSQMQSSNFGQSRGNYNPNRGGQRGRGRGGPANGYSKGIGSGRGGYSNGRGGYQGYYGNREGYGNNYGNNFRRGGGMQRGGGGNRPPRGGQSTRGNPRGGYRPRDQ
ncbi:caprin-1-like [Limulus polyphemus]|uniref:Caprin-1-like n=1 Tax=Limulus polyphemus TaxID=6850 RepID=A0ABM1SKK3_LIMPO|nr:caprin-1-like [Limulus polyphemus]